MYNQLLSSFLEYDIAQNIWIKINSSNTLSPSPIYYSAVVVDDLVFIFGGMVNISGNSVKDLLMYNITTKFWRTITPNGPSISLVSTFTVPSFAKTVLLFGGYSYSAVNGFIPHDDFYKYNISSNQWTLL